MRKEDPLEGKVPDKVQRFDISKYIRDRYSEDTEFLNQGYGVGRAASKAGRLFGHHVNLWKQVKRGWDENTSRNVKCSFTVFHTVMLALTIKPQTSAQITKNAGTLSKASVNKVLRVVRNLDVVSYARDIRSDTRRLVYWIEKEKSP